MPPKSLNLKPDGIAQSSFAGNLTVTVYNINGNLASTMSGNTWVQLYNSNYSLLSNGVQYINSTSQVMWSNLQTGTYYIEVYHTPTSGINETEFWGANSVTISAGSTTSYTFTRHAPWVYSVQYSSSSIALGQNVTITVSVKNQESYSLAIYAQLVFSASKQEPYAFNQSSQNISVPGNSTYTFTYTFAPNSTGTYYVDATAFGMYNNKFTVTDQWTWSMPLSVSATPNINLDILNASLSTQYPVEGQTFYLDLKVHNPNSAGINAPSFLQVYKSLPTLDAQKHAPTLSLILVGGPQVVSPNETTTIVYAAQALWNFAAPPTLVGFLESVATNLAIQLISGSMLSSFQNFVKSHLFTSEGVVSKEWPMVKEGINLVWNLAFSTLNDARCVFAVLKEFVGGVLTLGVNYAISFPSSYKVGFTGINSLPNLTVFASPYKVSLAVSEALQTISTSEIASVLDQAAMDSMGACTLGPIGCLVPGALLAAGLLIVPVTRALDQKALSDPSLNYRDLVSIRPSTAALSMQNNSSGYFTVQSEESFLAYINASITSMTRAYAAIMFHDPAAGFNQTMRAEAFIQNASSVLTNLSKALYSVELNVNKSITLNETNYNTSVGFIKRWGLPVNLTDLLTKIGVTPFLNESSLISQTYVPHEIVETNNMSLITSGFSGAETEFLKGIPFSVNFAVNGLPTSSSWHLVFDGESFSSAAGNLTAMATMGSYAYTVFGPTGYFAANQRGTVLINGQNVSIVISFHSGSNNSIPPVISQLPNSNGILLFAIVLFIVVVLIAIVSRRK